MSLLAVRLRREVWRTLPTVTRRPIFSTASMLDQYEEECCCGWKGLWIEDNVQRFNELMGCEDTVSCAVDVPEGRR